MIAGIVTTVLPPTTTGTAPPSVAPLDEPVQNRTQNVVEPDQQEHAQNHPRPAAEAAENQAADP